MSSVILSKGGGWRFCLFFFFQAEDGIRDLTVTGVQTCALPIWMRRDVIDTTAAEIDRARIAEAGDILFGRFERHRHPQGEWVESWSRCDRVTLTDRKSVV